MLNALYVGHGHPRVAFLHGLFGQGKNWKAIANGLQPELDSILFDLPNHGRSGWTDAFSYTSMADRVADCISGRFDGPAVVVGHSMGGKTAMMLALRHPQLVRALVVVDIAPDNSSHGYGFEQLTEAMRHAHLDGVTDRAQVDAELAKSIPDDKVRSFLLQNLHRTMGGFRWQPNLELISASLPLISGWDVPAGVRPFEKPVLWMRGAESDYVRDEHVRPMTRMFPRTELVTIPGAGHWVNADAPGAVIEALREFLADHRIIVRGGPVGPDAYSG